MAEHSQKFQAPKGTRDFYPADMAVRRYIESVWREVSINHGFEEIDGPTFEHLELYTKKSGEEIAKQLFSFRRADGDTDYALRPEFTPTLARMYAARAGELAKPTKWFCMPSFFRAERPQRGRLREFQQWNIDILGDDSPRADAEVIACTVDVLKCLGISCEHIRFKISHRDVVADLLLKMRVNPDQLPDAFALLDRREKMQVEDFERAAIELGIYVESFDACTKEFAHAFATGNMHPRIATQFVRDPATGKAKEVTVSLESLLELWENLRAMQIIDWCSLDFSIVRGLAYYTGTVFEVHEATGKERAIAGGGRYDGLVELFGGPRTPAVGVAMGDVVLRLVLEDHGLLPNEKDISERLRQRVDAFVFSAKEEADGDMIAIVSELRAAGMHARQSYKATRNVGKLLGDAGKCFAHTAIILGDELKENKVAVKDLESGEQELVGRDDVVAHVKKIVER